MPRHKVLIYAFVFIYTKKSKFVKNEHARYTFERYERSIKCNVEVLIFIEFKVKYGHKCMASWVN
jgi:hypothetical protein